MRSALKEEEGQLRVQEAVVHHIPDLLVILPGNRKWYLHHPVVPDPALRGDTGDWSHMRTSVLLMAQTRLGACTTIKMLSVFFCARWTALALSRALAF